MGEVRSMSIMESRKRPIGTASEEQPAKTICTRESIEHEPSLADTSSSFQDHIAIKIHLHSRKKANINDPKGSGGAEPKCDLGEVKVNSLNVSGENLHIEYSDDKYETYDEFNGLTWLEPIDVIATDEKTSEQVGCCMANLVRRQQIWHSFHKSMRAPVNELTVLAFDLFDRYGRLKDDYKHHPIRKGSGFWKDQLDEGDILLVEDVTVDQRYRQRGIGTRLVQALLSAASKKIDGGKFVVLAWPDPFKGDNFHQTMENLVGYLSYNFIERKDAQAIKWLRSVGFRRIGSSIWFGTLVGHDAQSQLPPIAEDYDPPPISRSNNLVPESIRRAFETSKDKVLVKALQKHLGQAEPNDERWLATDMKGNTLMHIAAMAHEPACLAWMMAQPGGRRLQNIRNQDYDTPLEALELVLDKSRTRLFTGGRFLLHYSDAFRGYPKNAVRCLAILKGVHHEPKDEGWKRLAGGCTCGHCFEGCMSPRMRLSLALQAGILHDMFTDQLAVMGTRQWVSENAEDAFPFYCVNMMRHSKSMCRGLISLLKHTSNCLCAGMLPNEFNIMSVHDTDEKIPVDTKNFFKGGGKLEAVNKLVFEAAIDDFTSTGESIPFWFEPEEGEVLPRCRNDHEYGYVSVKCGYGTIEPF